MLRLHRLAYTLVVLDLLLLSITEVAAQTIPIVSPWMDHHDRIEQNLARLVPAVEIERVDLERNGGYRSLDWFPAFGTDTKLDLRNRRLVILENAPMSALELLKDHLGRPLDQALRVWVRGGGHLLIVGGAPSLESYAGSAYEELMGFDPVSDLEAFRSRKKRVVNVQSSPAPFIEYLHAGEIRDARILLRADDAPFLIEKPFGQGRVTTLLSGAQGQLMKDGEEHPNEWFSSQAWTDVLRDVVSKSMKQGFTIGPDPPALQPQQTLTSHAFDIRMFSIGNVPYPFAFAKGEARARADELRAQGFTSVVGFSIYRRPKDDQQLMTEIAESGLRIVFYESVRRDSSPDVFGSKSHEPARSLGRDGKDMGWDVHDDRFRSAPERSLVQNRAYLRNIPLRAIQIIEEFPDGDMAGPTLRSAWRRAGISTTVSPGHRDWIAAMKIRADETHETFRRTREIGQKLFPGQPQSTYLPGSYWSRPHDYAYRLTTLAESVDELLGPAYGYSGASRISGPASVRRSATESWSALRDSGSSQPHMAVYAMGRSLHPGPASVPNLNTWIETSWTALAHGAQGLAYWALPKGSALNGLAAHHAEMSTLGPWLSAVPRTSARVALLESWTSRSEASNPAAAASFASCLHRTLDALELGFEDIDVVFEERLDRVPEETKAIVIAGTPAISREAASALVRFLDEGGHVFRDPDSAVRIAPGDRPLDLARLTRHPDRIHPTPITARCAAVKTSPSASARIWDTRLRKHGLRPRAATEDVETGAALRGSDEIAHLYMLNHSGKATRVKAQLSPEWANRSWSNLRDPSSGILTTENGLETTALIASGDAIVLASVARPLAKVSVDLSTSGARSILEIRGFDEKDAALAEGYPLALTLETDCTDPKLRSLVLRDGMALVPLPACAQSRGAELGWTLTDPISNRPVHRRALAPISDTR